MYDRFYWDNLRASEFSHNNFNPHHAPLSAQEKIDRLNQEIDRIKANKECGYRRR